MTDGSRIDLRTGEDAELLVFVSAGPIIVALMTKLLLPGTPAICQISSPPRCSIEGCR